MALKYSGFKISINYGWGWNLPLTKFSGLFLSQLVLLGLTACLCISPANLDTHLSEIHAPLFILYEKPFRVDMGNEPARLGEIPPSARWDLSEVGWKFLTYECKCTELARLTGTNVVNDAFWFAEMHSLQYFRALSQAEVKLNFRLTWRTNVLHFCWRKKLSRDRIRRFIECEMFEKSRSQDNEFTLGMRLLIFI